MEFYCLPGVQAKEDKQSPDSLAVGAFYIDMPDSDKDYRNRVLLEMSSAWPNLNEWVEAEIIE